MQHVGPRQFFPPHCPYNGEHEEGTGAGDGTGAGISVVLILFI